MLNFGQETYDQETGFLLVCISSFLSLLQREPDRFRFPQYFCTVNQLVGAR